MNILTLAFVALTSLQTFAQTSLHIIDKSGEKTASVLAEISKITFEEGNLRLYKNNGDNMAFEVSNLQKLFFADISASNAFAIGENTAFALYPVPAIEQIFMEISCTQTERLQISFLNLQGHIVWQGEKSALAGENHMRLDINGLPPGVYVCRVNNGDELVTRKFIVKY